MHSQIQSPLTTVSMDSCRILSLSSWLLSACWTHNLSFNDKSNLLWKHSSFYHTNEAHPNKQCLLTTSNTLSRHCHTNDYCLPVNHHCQWFHLSALAADHTKILQSFLTKNFHLPCFPYSPLRTLLPIISIRAGVSQLGLWRLLSCLFSIWI